MQPFGIVSKQKKLALCIDAGEYEGVSLFAMKIYEYLPDTISEKEGFLRVIDEDGESYYYDAKAFLKINAHRNGLLIPFMSSRKTHAQRPVRERLKTNRQIRTQTAKRV